MDLDRLGTRQPCGRPIQTDEDDGGAADGTLVDGVCEVAQRRGNGAFLGLSPVLDDHHAGLRAGARGEQLLAHQRRIGDPHVNGKGRVRGRSARQSRSGTPSALLAVSRVN